jgi:hypothetical protein
MKTDCGDQDAGTYSMFCARAAHGWISWVLRQVIAWVSTFVADKKAGDSTTPDLPDTYVRSNS